MFTVAGPVHAIETWAEHWTDHPKPFVWHKTAAEIIENVRRGGAVLTHSNARRTTRGQANQSLMTSLGPQSDNSC